MFVAFRMSRRERRAIISSGSGGSGGVLTVVTFASDFSYFKKVFGWIVKKADISWGHPVALTFLV